MHTKWFALFLVTLAACAAPPRSEGKLLIIGGGLRAKNEAIYQAFTVGAGPGGSLVVLPTASGVPEESGPGTCTDIEPHLLDGQSLEVVPIERDTPERAQDEAIVEQLLAADGFWFTGGVQSRILNVFRPEEGDSPAYAVVAQRLQEGAIVAGTSAGAAMMSDPMIAWGNSREALLLGLVNEVEDRGVGIEQGMGFFPFGIVDQHFLRRGRLGRLLIALELTGSTHGFGVSDNRAFLVDLGEDRGMAIGEAGVLVVDTLAAERDGYTLHGLRLHLLGDGDAYRFGAQAVDPAPDKTAHRTADSAAPGDEALEPWGRNTVPRLMRRLAADPAQPQRAVGEVFELVLSVDEHTRFLTRDDDPQTLCAIGVRLDILAGENAAAEAARLKEEMEREGTGE